MDTIRSCLVQSAANDLLPLISTLSRATLPQQLHCMSALVNRSDALSGSLPLNGTASPVYCNVRLHRDRTSSDEPSWALGPFPGARAGHVARRQGDWGLFFMCPSSEPLCVTARGTDMGSRNLVFDPAPQHYVCPISAPFPNRIGPTFNWAQSHLGNARTLRVR